MSEIALESTNDFGMIFTSNQQCELQGIVVPLESLHYFEMFPTGYGLHYHQVTVSQFAEGFYQYLTKRNDIK